MNSDRVEISAATLATPPTDNNEIMSHSPRDSLNPKLTLQLRKGVAPILDLCNIYALSGYVSNLDAENEAVAKHCRAKAMFVFHLLVLLMFRFCSSRPLQVMPSRQPRRSAADFASAIQKPMGSASVAVTVGQRKSNIV